VQITPIPGRAEAILPEEERIGLADLNVRHKLLPEPHRHVLQGIDAQGIEAKVKPGFNGSFDVIPEIDISLIKGSKSEHFMMNQLKFIIPIGYLRIVMIKIIAVMVKVGERQTIIRNNPLAAM
jgi:hypothetical protein